MRRAIAATAALATSSLLWMIRLIGGDTPLDQGPAALLGANLVVLAVIAVVAMLVARSRWGRWLGIGLAAAGGVLAVALPVDGWWMAAVATTAVAGAGLAGTWTKGVVRDLPPAAGPPPEGVLIPIGLLMVPAMAALVGHDGLQPRHRLVAAGAAAVAFLYSKAGPGALLAVRVLAPLGLAVAGWFEGWPAGLVWIGVAVGLVVVAWRVGARLAIRPLVTQGRPVPIPPELVPGEILDAAGLDERGRPRG
jgi:hypothetical protein